MKVIAIFFSIVLLTGCIPRPNKFAFVQDLIEDGTKEMKMCRFDCKREETQCEIKINTADSFNSGKAVYWDFLTRSSHDREKNSAIQGCQSEFERCFVDICGGKVMIRDVN